MTDDELPLEWMEYGYQCSVCGYMESWTTEIASNLSAILHVRTEHPFSSRYSGVPAPGLPTDYGTRLEDWESQL